MTKRWKASPFLTAAALAVATVACNGGSSSVTGPDAAGAVAPTPGGVTIAGTVQSAASAGGEMGASSVSGLRVSVTGTALQTTTDGSGRFTLSGVPSGRAELRFEGSGIDARLELEGLQSGQTLTLTVRVSGSSATRVDDDGSEVELKGKVESVSPDKNSLVVSGRPVSVTPGSTRLLDRNNQPIPLSGFKPGDSVQVEGVAQADGSIRAEKIKLEDDSEDDDDDNGQQEVEFTGTISNEADPLLIGGRSVTTDSNTKYLGRKNETLLRSDVVKSGNKVEVEGHQSGSSVLAKKIKLED